MMWIRGHKVMLILVLLVSVIALVPLYGIAFPPLVDLPEHILISKLLWEKLSGVSHLDLETSWFIGYRLFPIFMLVVFPLCKLLGISFIYLPRIVPITLICTHAIVVAVTLYAGVKSRSWKSWVLAVCFSLPAVVCMYSACWFIGFVNYTLAITLLILAIFLTERVLQAGKLLDACLLFFALLLVYASHPFAVSFWLLWYLSRGLASMATQTFSVEWKRLTCLGLVFLPIVLYQFWATRATGLALPSSSVLHQPAIVTIGDWYQNRFRGVFDGVLLQADDIADPKIFARFAIGLIIAATVFAFISTQAKGVRNMMLSSIVLIFLASWINEKFIPVPSVSAWIAYDYRFASTGCAIGLFVAGMALIQIIPASMDTLQSRALFGVLSLLAVFSAIASIRHLVDVREAYARYDVQARRYMAKVFNHEPPVGIHLPHSRWHPDGTLIRLYVCLVKPDCNPPGTTFYTGYVRDLYPVKFRSAERVLSRRELATWRNQAPTGPLVGYWKLNEPNRNDACIDSSGNGNMGTPHGTNVVDEKIGHVRTFNGRSDYIHIPAIYVSDAITVAAWVYSNNFVQNGFVVMKNPVNTQWGLFFESDGFLKWRGGGPESLVCSAPSNGEWHHIVSKQDGRLASLYMDGVLCVTGNLSVTGNAPSSINIGRFDSGYYFTGRIAEVRIYNRALSDSEVSGIFTSTPLTVPSAWSSPSEGQLNY
jgi:hypothetical protein